jgi:hypothetical protein
LISPKTIQKLIDDGKTDIALERINGRLKNKPTPELHLLRIKALSRLESHEETLILQTSLEWLGIHAPEQLSEVRADLHEVIQRRLALIPGLEHKSDEPPVPDALTILHAMLPLADDFPIIHLSYGLLLMHKAQTFRSETKSPLDLLDEILNRAMEKANPNREANREPLEEKQLDLYQQAQYRLEQAQQHFAEDDSRCGSILDAMGQVCEALDDPIGAWQAYHKAQSYSQDVRGKLSRLATTIKERVQAETLVHIDRLLREGELDKAAAVLAACSGGDSPEFRIRAADLAFLRGDFEGAVARYRQFLE